jgi:DNA-binding IclR family transcriptional regulator
MNYRRIIRILAAINCRNSGASVAAIAAQAKVAPSTVHRWLKNAPPTTRYWLKRAP